MAASPLPLTPCAAQARVLILLVPSLLGRKPSQPALRAPDLRVPVVWVPSLGQGPPISSCQTQPTRERAQLESKSFSFSVPCLHGRAQQNIEALEAKPTEPPSPPGILQVHRLCHECHWKWAVIEASVRCSDDASYHGHRKLRRCFHVNLRHNELWRSPELHRHG